MIERALVVHVVMPLPKSPRNFQIEICTIHFYDIIFAPALWDFFIEILFIDSYSSYDSSIYAHYFKLRRLSSNGFKTTWVSKNSMIWRDLSYEFLHAIPNLAKLRNKHNCRKRIRKLSGIGIEVNSIALKTQNLK